MNRVLVIFTIHTDNLPPNFPEILKKEKEVVAEWMSQGLLEQIYLQPTRNGAVLMFKDLDEARVDQLMRTLPFYQFVKSVEILPLIKED
jgi:muconolactone D-isomerase